MNPQEMIRNFVIIAHIDHGKSTLADRFLEITGTIERRAMKAQYLDQLESERERGITIKMAPVRMSYTFNSQLYTLNLIDTPGHSDFSYEVSRALAAVEGAILLVDGTQGIQAQTLANFENAHRAGLMVIGAVNKIDMAPPQLEQVVRDAAALIGTTPEHIMRVSAKTGEGTEQLLNTVIQTIPPPPLHDAPISRALIFDSLYNDHKGIIAFVRVVDGCFKRGDAIMFAATGAEAGIKEVGYFKPQLQPCVALATGEIGYIATGIKDPAKLKIGDTIICAPAPLAPAAAERHALPGYREPQPVVFVSLYPENASAYDNLHQALIKLRLTDASLHIEPETSEVLGRGFKGGFLGKLHFEIAAERLEKEFDIATVHSFPSVEYRVHTRGCLQTIHNPKDFPAENDGVEEPMTQLEIITPPQYMGNILALKELFRFGTFETKTLGARLVLSATLPLADLMSDLDDRLKSISEGYASLSYVIIGFQKGDVEKVEILVAGHVIPGLTRILPKEKMLREARLTVERLKDLLPRQQFTQAVQAAVRGKIIARETIPALRKDVTGYLYGGDRTRKMKLWKKQQKGKARLKDIAEKSHVKIHASIFKELMKK